MSCRNYFKFNSVGRYCYYYVDDVRFSRGELRRRRLYSSPFYYKPGSVEYLCRPRDLGTVRTIIIIIVAEAVIRKPFSPKKNIIFVT